MLSETPTCMICLEPIRKISLICHSERPAGAKNLDRLPEIPVENEILHRSAPQNDMVVMNLRIET